MRIVFIEIPVRVKDGAWWTQHEITIEATAGDDEHISYVLDRLGRTLAESLSARKDGE